MENGIPKTQLHPFPLPATCGSTPSASQRKKEKKNCSWGMSPPGLDRTTSQPHAELCYRYTTKDDVISTIVDRDYSYSPTRACPVCCYCLLRKCHIALRTPLSPHARRSRWRLMDGSGCAPRGSPQPLLPPAVLGWGASTMRATISISARPGLLARCLVCVHHVEPYCFITIKAAPILFPLFIFTSALGVNDSCNEPPRHD